jgi:hypothetical protein
LAGWRGAVLQQCGILRCAFALVGIMEMNASRMFLCMRKSSCMDEAAYCG